MNFQNIVPDKSISLFVKRILIFEENNPKQKTNLPFFADGYPGIMFQETENGVLVNPHKKLMPVFFLYGQTIKPIELEINGTYKLIVFQLYPFVLKSFFKVAPQTINDDCYNLEQLQEIDIFTFIKQIKNLKTTARKTENITSLLYQLFQTKKQTLDFKIKQVIEFILKTKGQESITNLASELKLNERTLERRFLNEVGLSPKQFSKIIQFQLSLEQLTLKDFTKLTDIVYANGFADQSHFIKVFKAFTGKTPKKFEEHK
jgi:AraC-like DNA-binding protein